MPPDASSQPLGFRFGGLAAGACGTDPKPPLVTVGSADEMMRDPHEGQYRLPSGTDARQRGQTIVAGHYHLATRLSVTWLSTARVRTRERSKRARERSRDLPEWC